MICSANIIQLNNEIAEVGRNDLPFLFVKQKSNNQDNLNDSKTMAQVSSLFKSISPGATIDDATTGLVSIMKANINALLYSDMQLAHI